MEAKYETPDSWTENKQLKTSTGHTKARNDAKWDIYKEDIHRLYMTKDLSLKVTRKLIANAHNFETSERKWKTKFEEWGYTKYIPAKDMTILVKKADQRLREYGKITQFYHRGKRMATEKLENFQRKKMKHEQDDEMLMGCLTPQNITYDTPPEISITQEQDSYVTGLTEFFSDEATFASPGEVSLPSIPVPIPNETIESATGHDTKFSSPMLGYATSLPLVVSDIDGQHHSILIQATNGTPFSAETLTPISLLQQPNRSFVNPSSLALNHGNPNAMTLGIDSGSATFNINRLSLHDSNDVSPIPNFQNDSLSPTLGGLVDESNQPDELMITSSIIPLASGLEDLVFPEEELQPQRDFTS